MDKWYYHDLKFLFDRNIFKSISYIGDLEIVILLYWPQGTNKYKATAN